ncbi:hypothetical protein [Nannocystis pusilla]|uniref:hypothetical protein n=1 Tax=Nannocystis pusilla TaxID=889268 RepID=UPI003DA63A09
MTSAGGVAAFRNAALDLEVVGFRFAGDQIDLGVGRTDGSADDVAVARINDSDAHAAVAIKDGTNRLTVIPYFVRTNADLVRGVSRTETTVGLGQVEATRSPNHGGVVVAIKNSQNSLSVINYGVTLTGTEQLTVDRRGSDATGGDIKDVDIATVVQGRGLTQTSGAFKGVVTAEIASDDSVWLRSWSISTDGQTLTDADSEQARSLNNEQNFVATDVDVAVTGVLDGRELIVLSIATAAGLRVQTWAISTTGQLTRVDQHDAGTVVDIDSARAAGQDAVVAVRLQNDGLSLISFHVTPQGQLRRSGTRDAGGISALAVDGRSSQDDLMVFSRGLTSGDLSLLYHDTHYSLLH